MSETRDRIPPHLRPFVVEQDYGAYDEIDQAVWRFILLQTFGRLAETAHPAYVEGLRQTGISVERIPRIAEMDACLAAYGWGAVAVDGFIPPRAFQEFQALGIMTIAADIRSSDHLVYTPAPDIVHESAGHAPIVPDPAYRAVLQRFGEIGARAFSSPADRRLDAAIHRLSAVKEDAEATAADLARADAELAEAQAAVPYLSEAALLSRLHWWTVEYGLVGTPSDYRIYGAGLLSSLAESHFCHDPAVTKLPLTARCTEQDYDITQPQPQLFVAEDFAHLGAVLDQVATRFAQTVGGAVAVERAIASGELATIELSTGLQLLGVLAEVLGDADHPAAYLKLAGPCALAVGGAILPGHDRRAHPEGYGTPLGPLADGSALWRLGEADLARFRVEGDAGRIVLRYASGVEARGRLERCVTSEAGRLLLLTLSDCRVTRGDALLFDPAWGVYDLAVGASVTRAYAGAADPAHTTDAATAETSGKTAPHRRPRRGADAEMLDLYRRALHLWERPQSPELVHEFEAITAVLDADFPEKWLLRWNLLECLRKADRGAELGDRLRHDLLAIEARRPRDLPITMGLRYLDERYPTRA